MRTLLETTWLELKLAGREPTTVVFTVAPPVLVLYVLGGVLGDTPDPGGIFFRGLGPMAYYVPAYVGLVIASMGLIGLPVHLASYRELGVLLGSVLPTARAAQGAGLLLWFLMMMLAGAGPPPEVLPSALSTVADLTPLKHVIVALQDPWLGFGQNVTERGIVAGVIVLCGVLALRLFRWE